MAIIVAASFGCFARDLARIATTQVPTTSPCEAEEEDAKDDGARTTI